MKYVFRFVGFIVVIAVIAALALYTLNSFGYLRGPVSAWINDVANHCQGVVIDTQQFIEETGIRLPTITIQTAPPTAEPAVSDAEPQLSLQLP